MESLDELIDVTKLTISPIAKPMASEKVFDIKCLIEGHGTGFFCRIPFPDINHLLQVLITNNHVLGEKDNVKGTKI